jgi:sugar lactone lactonase YvrE
MSIQWRKMQTRAATAVACTCCALAVPGSPLPASAADVAVTSFGTPGDEGTAELLAGRPTGFVARWEPKKGWAHVAGSEFGGDNGVAATPDGGVLYVNDWSDGTLRVLSLRDGVKPATIRVGDFHPDNVHILPDGNLLIAGQIGTARDIMAFVKAPTCSVGSMIVVVDPRTRRVRSHWTIAPTSTFGAASTALLYGHDYWVSSFRGDRIVRLGPAPGE